MFEVFKAPVLLIASPLLLAIRASRHSTGVLLDCGYGMTQAITFYQGAEAVILNSLRRAEIGGDDLTNFMIRLLAENKQNSPCDEAESLIRYQIANDIKESFGRVQTDAQRKERRRKTKDQSEEMIYQTEDGKSVTVVDEHLRCAEGLFDPSLLGSEEPGIHKLVYSSIMHCDQEYQDVLFSNVVVAGGCALFNGFSQRLEKELTDMLALVRKPAGGVNVSLSTDRTDLSAWRGGAMLAYAECFPSKVVSIHEYAEHGARLLNEKLQ